jgi:hypothetical protein
MRNAVLAIAVAACCAASPALADDFGIPARKAGQWKIQMVPETAKAVPAMTFQLCLDSESDKALMSAGAGMAAGAKCTMTKAVQEADGIAFDGACDMGAMKTKSHTVISGDFQSSYTMKITSDTTGGPAAMPKHSVMTQNATYEGACADGMEPGDMMMPGGMKVNALKAMKPGG